MVERKIELTWRCTSCGQRNLGRHMACTACGSPKDDTEHYEMPPDPAAQASVTDPALIALARAGANWLCAFCGSNARAPEGRCAQCGAAQGDAARPAALLPARPATRRALPLTLPIALGALFVLLVLCGIGGLVARRPARPPIVQAQTAHRDVAARVERATWAHVVDVERWQIVAREGFSEQKPSDALEVKTAGERVHHVDKLPDGTTTETYTDHETRLENEPYTAQEQCGEDCRSLPETCRERCTNDQNGFATCRTECSGGGQSCAPRYCSVQKTRVVHKTFPVQKTRTVPRFKDVPRMAPWYTWKVWDWARVRSVEESGTGFETRWPSAEAIALGQDLGEDERERERRRASYQIALVAGDGTRHTLNPPSLAEYQRYRDAQVTLRVEPYGGVRVIDGP